MILICPICATRYQIDEAGVADGRAVQCAACGHGWKVLAHPQDAQPPDPGFAAGRRRTLARVDVESMRREAEQALVRSSPQFAYRNQRKTRHHRQVLLATVLPWLSVAGVLVLAVLAAYLWRSPLMHALPGVVPLYESVGLGPGADFVLRNLSVEHDSHDGDGVMIVRGRAVNMSKSERPPPGINVIVLDQDGHDLLTVGAHIETLRVAPGGHEEFVVRIEQVPETAHAVDVRFTNDGAQADDHGAPDPEHH